MATLSSKISELSGLATAAQGVLADTAVQPNDSSVAKAWVNFNGTGTVAVRNSMNVASITDNGVGNHTVNFTNSMSADYSALVTVRNENGVVSTTLTPAPVNTSSFGMYTWTTTNALADVSTLCGTTHGDLA
jgi:hypothetical protein